VLVMPFQNLTRDMLRYAIIGGTSYDKLNNTNAHLGVGDSATAQAAAQTEPQAASNKTRKAMEAGHHTRSANQLML
jgi:hypothetical protein